LELLAQGPRTVEALAKESDLSIANGSQHLQVPGRTSDRQIIYYKSNTGVGIQFAADGALIYDACRKKGLGRELPNEWFGADLSEWVDKGFMPSP
jgi:hypothetical protein